jgi:4-hydroxyacetophenone monooxygenase
VTALPGSAGLITADDQTIREALRDAHLPSLLPAVAQTTGDISILRPDLAPDTSIWTKEPDGMPLPAQAAARELIFAALTRFRDAGCPTPPQPSAEHVLQMMRFITGPSVTEEYVPFLLEELDIADQDPRAPTWTKDDVAPDRDFRVAIIGAGPSGILAGVRLKQANIPFVIFEKNSEVGGAWWENSYPGARVDSPNHLYSYSFAQRADWPSWYSTQPVLLDYFRDCVDEFGLRADIRFNTEVESATYDDARSVWVVVARSSAGAEGVEAQALISAVGQLNRPSIPDFPGRDSFAGPAFHSAQWDHDVDLTGKRVAVIGSGASGSQIIPNVAKQAGELRIFQRTPNWYVPVPNHIRAVPEGMRWLLQHVPFYARWHRFYRFWYLGDGCYPIAQVDPRWTGTDRAVGRDNDRFRVMLTDYLVEQFEDRPDLLEEVLPTYPPVSKRLLLDTGEWAATLKRSNVELITGAVQAITPRGVVTSDGVEHPTDVIIYATGFQATKFLTPIVVRGRDGIELNEYWAGEPRAYVGISIPNFPNLFVMYGPNTNGVITGGSRLYNAECEISYILGCLRLLLQNGCAAMDCRQDAHDAYNVWMDEGSRSVAWGVTTANSWYKTASGHISQCWPFTLLEYWKRTKQPDPDAYIFT